ncbi:MFS general substrate transporter [Mollisia scopiformis]|uniref:MFS general substrate transporter n=1 Tax=Mollisia scopiformis TaxID=149040 RepID=A0A194X270_MOLSC|nr:MFS general substrate transporter [Mollisia scopiformis]KUJ14268.1 MFS general substrate transporter [Mollisia scopiformis]
MSAGIEQPVPVPSDSAMDVEKPSNVKRVVTLGTIRHRHEHTNEIILVPTPSSDPNDPLNWSQSFKWYMAIVICLAMFMCNFLAAGPTIAIVQTAMEFFPTMAVVPAISKTAYFFTTTALLQGTGNLIWMPLVNKYGRRPIYLISYTLYLACAIWAACTYTYGSFLAARIIMGFAAGAAETMAPLSIADVFFLHERGTIMAMYSAALVSGVSGGIIIAGLITIDHNWRYIYYTAIALVGGTLVLAYFTFPETNYRREVETDSDSNQPLTDNLPSEKLGATHHEAATNIPVKKSYIQRLAIFSGTYTSESFWKLFFRPFGLILLPPVLWSSLVQSVTIGFIVAVTSNVASAYQSTYDFKAWQTGLCFIAAIIGALIGIFCGGNFGDATADFFTKRNGGIREPEMRLPALMISLITTPLALILYGVGIQKQLHWMCPTVGLALLNFSIVQATNVSLVYVIDAYRPIAGEVTLTVMAFKSAFGFLLSFYTNPWVAKSGYLNAYGAMAGISAAVLIFWIPFYIWGKRIRHATWHWTVVRYVHWEEDREVGE